MPKALAPAVLALLHAAPARAEYELVPDPDLWLAGAVAVLGLALLILLLRPLACWYFRVNERVALLGELRDLVAGEIERAGREREIRAAMGASEPETVCPKCQARYAGDLRGRFCDACGARL